MKRAANRKGRQGAATLLNDGDKHELRVANVQKRLVETQQQ